jgi:polar amino acid transport system permease protein
MLPSFGIYVDRMTVAFITFILNYTAYFIEILRAGIEAIPKEQFESASVEGAHAINIYQKIILPQAIRKELPTITNEIITLIKDTSLVTVIAISDLMRGVKEIVSRDFTLSPFALAAIFYLVISYLIITLMKFIENKIDFYETI